MSDERKPAVHIGWLVATRLDEVQSALLDRVMTSVRERLTRQFPGYDWDMRRIQRRVAPPEGVLDPLVLLELGAEEKLHRRLDLVLVFVPNELMPRNRIYIAGVPSSILEVAVLSSARFMDDPDPACHLTGLALHLLGHLLGLPHEEAGIMRCTEETTHIQPEDYSPEARALVEERLARIADLRLEEQGGTEGRLRFWWRTWMSDPLGILRDVFAYAPWRMPLYLGRYTAATAVTVIFLFLSAEAWELGARMQGNHLGMGAVVICILAALSLYLGQNLHQMGRVATLREQLTRTRMTLFGALLAGMGALWLALFAIGLVVMEAFPKAVFAGWAGVAPERLSLTHYAAFMANLGVVAGAFGGNLEDEAEIKAVLLFDEET